MLYSALSDGMVDMVTVDSSNKTCRVLMCCIQQQYKVGSMLESHEDPEARGVWTW